MSITKTAELRKIDPFECIKAIFEDEVLFTNFLRAKKLTNKLIFVSQG